MSSEIERRFYDPIEHHDRILDKNAKLVQKTRDHILPDLEQALNLVCFYAATFDQVGFPDPNIVEVRKLLNKYGMQLTRRPAARIIVDEVDITEHPDSTPGEVIEAEEIEEAEVIEVTEAEIMEEFKRLQQEND